jgi:hypothetical protein
MVSYGAGGILSMTKAGRFVFLWVCLTSSVVTKFALAQTSCPSQESICASKTKALSNLLLSCSGGSVWCIENIWVDWLSHNPNCREEGQVVCFNTCANAGVEESWCLSKCR